jgi:type IV pilus assembly protein PilC
VILILVSLGVIAFMLFYVVPVFDLVFRDMKVDLPLTTKAILSISAAIKGHLIHFSILGFLLIVFFIFARRSEEFTKRILDIISRLPFIGSLIRKFRIARFSATLSMLLAGGIPVLEAMRIVASGVREKTQIVGMNKIITALHQGNELSQALHQSELVDAMAIQMVGVGEKSGDLPVMLEAVAEIYEEEMDHDIEIATAMVEPILLLVMGGVIALIVVSIFIPVIQLSSAF